MKKLLGIAATTVFLALLGTNLSTAGDLTVSGSVGVGTTSPSEKLEVSNTSGNNKINIRSGNASLATLSFSDQDANEKGAVQYVHSEDAIYFKSNGSENMMINSSGNVGIGTVIPGARIHVYKTGGGILGRFIADSDAMTGVQIKTTATSGTGNIIDWRNGANADGSGGSTVMLIKNNGNVGIGTFSPVEQLDIVKSQAADTLIRVDNTNTSAAAYSGLRLYRSNNNEGWDIRRQGSTGKLFISSVSGGTPADKVTFQADGKVGIGTASPQARLHVAGTPGTDGVMFPDGTLQTTASTGDGTFTTDCHGHAIWGHQNPYGYHIGMCESSYVVRDLLNMVSGVDGMTCCTD
jgi:hypothetical protein